MNRAAKPLLCIALLAACAGPVGAQGSKDAPAALDLRGVTINMGQNNGEIEPLWRASGVFDGTPYKIQYSSFNNPLDNYTALAAGRIDVSSSSLSTAAQLQQASAEPWTAKSAPIKILVVRVSDYPGSLDRYVLLAGSKSGITTFTPDSIRGKRIAYSPGGNNALVFYAALQKLGMTMKDVQPVQLDTTANSLALLNNQVDIVSGSIDLYGPALASGAKIIESSKILGLPIQSGVLANAKALSDPAKAAAIADMVKRYIAFENWFTTHPKEAIAAYMNGRNFRQGQAETAWKYGRVLVQPVSKEVVAQAQSVSDLLLKFGLFTKNTDASVLFDDRLSKSVEQTMADMKFKENLATSMASPGP